MLRNVEDGSSECQNKSDAAEAIRTQVESLLSVLCESMESSDKRESHAEIVLGKLSQLSSSCFEFITEHRVIFGTIALCVLRHWFLLPLPSQKGYKETLVITLSVLRIVRDVLSTVKGMSIELPLVSQSGVHDSLDSSDEDDSDDDSFMDRVSSIVFSSLPSRPAFSMQNGDYVFSPYQLLYFYNLVVSSVLIDLDRDDIISSESEDDDLIGSEILDSQSGVSSSTPQVRDNSDSQYWLSNYPENVQKFLRKFIEPEMFDGQVLVMPRKFTSKQAQHFCNAAYCAVYSIKMRNVVLQEADILTCIYKLISRKKKKRPELVEALKSCIMFMHNIPVVSTLEDTILISKETFTHCFPMRRASVFPQSADLEIASTRSVSSRSSYTHLMSEEDQIKLVVDWFKTTSPSNKFINVELCKFAEADLVLRYSNFSLIFECKRSMTHRTKGRKQLTKLCKGFACWDSRVIGVLYTPVGYEIVCDYGDKSIDISAVLPTLEVAQFYSMLFESTTENNHVSDTLPLISQSGVPSYMRSKKSSESLLPDSQHQTAAKSYPSIVVDAGAYYSVRMRPSLDTSSPWSMNNIFRDTNTINHDVKFLQHKFADEQRDHFAASGSASCNPKQVTPLMRLMSEMKISTVSSNGLSVQESTQVAPVSEDDDIGV